MGRVIYNAIVMDSIKKKTIMTKLVFDRMYDLFVLGHAEIHVPMVKWNLGYDDWFVKKFKNIKLKRFTSQSISPLSIALMSQSVDVVKEILSRCKPDGIDLKNTYGKLWSSLVDSVTSFRYE